MEQELRNKMCIRHILICLDQTKLKRMLAVVRNRVPQILPPLGSFPVTIGGFTRVKAEQASRVSRSTNNQIKSTKSIRKEQNNMKLHKRQQSR